MTVLHVQSWAVHKCIANSGVFYLAKSLLISKTIFSEKMQPFLVQ